MTEFRVGMHIGSGHINDSDQSGSCYLHFHAGKLYLDLPIPRIIWPHREKVIPVSWDAATISRLGRDYYWLETERRYGWYIFGDHFMVYLGRCTDDSKTEQKWSCFLPFATWRFVRHTLYNPDESIAWEGGNRAPFQEMWDAEKKIEKQVFRFRDFDGEEIEARTHVEEREWRFGNGWFKWLSVFRRAKISRSIDIEFSKEVGPKKGSWKGGTLGHGSDIELGESQFSAFRRYCRKHNLTLIA